MAFWLAVHDLGLAVLLAGLSIPLILGKVPPNAWYGFRVPRAFASQENWYRINRYGGKVLAGWASLLVLTGIIKLTMPDDAFETVWGVAFIAGPLVVVTAGAIVQTLLYVRTV
jgi:uncharacterized membrane protein